MPTINGKHNLNHSERLVMFKIAQNLSWHGIFFQAVGKLIIETGYVDIIQNSCYNLELHTHGMSKLSRVSKVG